MTYGQLTVLHSDYITFVGFSNPAKDRAVLKDVMGRYRTNVFYEFNKSRHDDYPPLYTMREDEWLGLPSAYKIFMLSESEYEAAIKLVGSWNHWQRLLKCKPFTDGVDDGGQWVGLNAWREEKKIREKAWALNQLKISAQGGSVSAQKILFEADKVAGKRGRPSSAEIRKEAAKQAETATKVKSDLERIKDIDGQAVSN